MVIYDKDNGKLYIPENGDRMVFDPNEAYQRGYDLGYQAGQAKAEEDCQNE